MGIPDCPLRWSLGRRWFCGGTYSRWAIPSSALGGVAPAPSSLRTSHKTARELFANLALFANSRATALLSQTSRRTEPNKPGLWCGLQARQANAALWCLKPKKLQWQFPMEAPRPRSPDGGRGHAAGCPRARARSLDPPEALDTVHRARRGGGAPPSPSPRQGQLFMTWSTPTAPETCGSVTIGPAGPTRDSPSRVHDGISPENLHTTTTYLCSRGAGHGTKDTVAVAPGLAHGRARGLQAYLLPTVTIPRARRPHRPPTLSLSHTPFKRRRSAGVSVTRRIAGPGAFRGYPHGLTLRVQRGRVRLQWRPATALSYGSLHSTCTAIPPGPRPPSLVAGVYHTSSPRAAVSLGVPSLILKRRR